MTIYSRPGTAGSIVALKTRYDNFIGGDWTKPVKGHYAEDLAPATGLRSPSTRDPPSRTSTSPWQQQEPRSRAGRLPRTRTAPLS